MMSDTKIANMALGHVGVSKQIGNLITERSLEANACREWFEVCRESALGDFHWSFATKFKTVGLVENNPTQEWAYSYRYPSDCIDVRRILSGQRTDVRATRVPFRIASDDEGGIILTDMQNAQIEYTWLNKDASKYSTNFATAMSLMLANYIVPQLSGGDPFQRQQKIMQLYAMEISKAATNNAIEEQADIEPDSEFVLARGGTSCASGGRRLPEDIG